MLIDLFVKNRECLVIGGGEVGERKSLQLLDSGAKVTVVSKEFTEKLIELGKSKILNLEKANVDEKFLERLDFKPSVVIVALDDRELNKKISDEARLSGFLFSVVDDPEISDFAMPAIAKMGKIRIGISTQGHSPAMAGILRKKVEKMITKEDLLQVELQSYARSLAKKHIGTPERRKEVLMKLIEDREITRFLKEDRVNDAKNIAKKIIVNEGR